MNKIDFEKIKLSGKGFKAPQGKEWLDDNVKLVSNGDIFYQVLYEDNQIGWIVDGTVQILADFTSHTDDGMIGKSVDDQVKYPFIYDPKNRLEGFVENLLDYDTENIQKVLTKYFDIDTSNIHGDIDLEDREGEDLFVIISTPSELIFVQTPKTSVRIRGNDQKEIIVLNRKDGKDSLFTINKNDGILFMDSGRKKIAVGPGSEIVINNKPLSKIINDATRSISESLKNIRFS